MEAWSGSVSVSRCQGNVSTDASSYANITVPCCSRTRYSPELPMATLVSNVAIFGVAYFPVYLLETWKPPHNNQISPEKQGKSCVTWMVTCGQHRYGGRSILGCKGSDRDSQVWMILYLQMLWSRQNPCYRRRTMNTSDGLWNGAETWTKLFFLTALREGANLGGRRHDISEKRKSLSSYETTWPLGLVMSFIIHGKILNHKVWRMNTDWDSNIPLQIATRCSAGWNGWLYDWVAYSSELRFCRVFRHCGLRTDQS